MKSFIIYTQFFLLALLHSNFSFSSNETKIDSLIDVLSHSKDYKSYLNQITDVILYYYHKNSDSTIFYCKEGIEKAKPKKDTNSLGFYNNVIGVSYKNLAEYDSAIVYLKKSIFYRQLEKYDEGVAAGNNNLATVYRLKGNYTKAVDYYIKSIDIFKQTDDLANIAEVYSNLGELYIELEEYDLAEYCFKESQNYYAENKSLISLAWVYHDVALLKTKLNQTDSALIYYEKSTDILKNKERFLEYSDILVSMSDILIDMQKYNKAYKLLTEAQIHYKSFNNAYGLANVYLKEGKYFESEHQYKKAIQKYKSALQLSNSTRAKSLLIDVYKGLYQSNKKIGNTGTALTFLEHYTALKDTVFNAEQNKIRLEYQIEFDALEKEKKIQELTQKATIEKIQSQQQNKQNELVKEKQKLFIYSLSIVVILIIILAFVLYRRNQIKTKLNRQLENAVKEREVLLREIHHRVKNNLQIVSSLLNLQSNNITEKTASDVLKDSQDRIKSLSILHEKLYKSKSLSEINFKTYVNELIQNLDKSFDLSKKHINIFQNIEETNLNIDFLVPCGLIINELITNSIKYAFPEKKEGEIIISGTFKNETYNLIIKDNGIGFPKNFNPKTSKTLGLRLVEGLVRQLKGEIIFNNFIEGIEIIINFKVK